jgi:hypothetical protein
MEQSSGAPRFNIYAFIHKALRAMMCNTLATVGTTDANDTACVDKTLAQVNELLDLCASHVEHENTFIHRAMEARAPGSSGDIVHDHEHHCTAITHLRAQANSVTQSHGPRRAVALALLYRELAVFIGQNLTHMEQEESANNAVLWATHSDDELRAIEASIQHVIAPPEMALCLRWMLAGLNFDERVGLLSDIRQSAPAPVFESVMTIARDTLFSNDFTKIRNTLTQALAA